MSSLSALLLLLLLIIPLSSALIERQSREFPSRFFIPDSALASQLLAQHPPYSQFGPIPAGGGRLGPVKRYFDSLAGQSLGKRGGGGGDEPMEGEEK